MSSIEITESATAVAEVQNPVDSFSRENLIKAGRIAAAAVLVVVIPGAGIVAAVGGVAYLASRMRSKGNVSNQ